MVTLTRTVRFAVSPGTDDPAAAQPSPSNSFAGYPTMIGLGAHYELDIRCRAHIDPVTGYTLNIKDIDAAARATIVPAIVAAFVARPASDPAGVLRDTLPALAVALAGRLDAVTWRLSPFYAIEMAASNPSRALLRQQFEFAASHRLHAPGLSDEANRACFGKCNHPSGHGHNYRVEPNVEVPVGVPGAAPAFTLLDLERLTKRTIIDRFDHTNLSVDRPEFMPPAGLNPSVENIAKVCFDLLAPAIADEGRGAALRSVTVWETDKTSCTYPG